MSTTPTPATTETPSRKVSQPALSRANWALRESKCNHWRPIIPRGVSRERLTQPDFWAVVAQDMVPFDFITCVFEDRSAMAELLVLSCGKGYADVVELAFYPLPALLVPSSTTLPPGFSVEYFGPDMRWGAKRIVDGVMITSGHDNRDDCVTALLDHGSLR